MWGRRYFCLVELYFEGEEGCLEGWLAELEIEVESHQDMLYNQTI